MTQENNSLQEQYRTLLIGEYQGKKLWEHIRDKDMTAAPCFVGDLYEASAAKLMVVGRAVNGWEVTFDDCSSLESTVNSVLTQKYNFDDVVKNKGIPYPEDMDKRNYFYYSSNFWRLIKYLLEAYGESDSCQDEKMSWYEDSKKWNRRIAWSNLYKVAPRKGTNPEWKMFKPQMQNYIDIIKGEIKANAPQKVLFVTDEGYFDPWKREPSFTKEFCIEMQRSKDSCIVGSGSCDGTKMIVCKRPDARGISHEQVRQMAQEVKDKFNSL